MTITLRPQTETLLREAADRAGQSADTLADDLLAQVLAEQARDFEESCAAIAEALADESGDTAFEEYVAQERRERPMAAPGDTAGTAG